MLVQFLRATTAQTDGSPLPIAIEPDYVSAFFADLTATNVVVLRMGDGRGFKIQGTYDEVKAKLPEGFLEFTRAVDSSGSDLSADDMVGEDDEVAPEVEHKISIKPKYVSAVLASQTAPNIAIARLSDGRGFSLTGGFAAVLNTMQGQGGVSHQAA